MPSVSEIDDQPEAHPHQQSDPRVGGEERHHAEADEHSHDGHERHQRRAEGTRNVRTRPAQDDDAALKARFAPLARALADNEAKIVAELNAAQGQPVDIGGYYRPDAARMAAAMRPSPTFNAALGAL